MGVVDAMDSLNNALVKVLFPTPDEPTFASVLSFFDQVFDHLVLEV